MRDDKQALHRGIALARYYLQDENPSVETIAQALWLHEELHQAQAVAVQNGVARAFGKK